MAAANRWSPVALSLAALLACAPGDSYSQEEPDDRVPADPRAAPLVRGTAVLQASPNDPEGGPVRDPSRPGASHPAPGAAAAGSGPAPGFRVGEGERLSAALARFLRARGWSLEWNDPQDFILQRGYTLDLGDAALATALGRILAPYRLTAVLHDPRSQRVVAVGPPHGRFLVGGEAEVAR